MPDGLGLADLSYRLILGRCDWSTSSLVTFQGDAVL